MTDLADVVQVGGEHDVVDRLRRDRELLGHRAGQVGHPVGVRTQVGGVLVDHGEQEVARLPLRGDAVVVLLRVHALVDDAQGRGRIAGLTRQEREAARRADRLVLLGQRLERLADGLLELGRRAVQEHAELIPAQPVGGARRGECRREAGAEAGQERVAGRMPVRVVIGLEAVEVEHGEHRGGVIGALGDGPLEVDQQAAAVAQAGEVVGERLAARLLDPGPHAARPCREQRRRHGHDPRAQGGHQHIAGLRYERHTPSYRQQIPISAASI